MGAARAFYTYFRKNSKSAKGKSRPDWRGGVCVLMYVCMCVYVPSTHGTVTHALCRKGGTCSFSAGKLKGGYSTAEVLSFLCDSISEEAIPTNLLWGGRLSSQLRCTLRGKSLLSWYFMQKCHILWVLFMGEIWLIRQTALCCYIYQCHMFFFNHAVRVRYIPKLA